MRKAFTLIEVLITVAILSILSTAIYFHIGQIIDSNESAYKQYSADRHLLNIHENLIALKNTSIINPHLTYYNIDMVEVYNSLIGGTTITSNLIAPESEYELIFELVESQEKYYKALISIKNSEIIDRKAKVMIYSIAK